MSSAASGPHAPGPDQGAPAPADAPGTARTKSDLIRGMRHELRTPVNHIIGYSEMLIEEAEEQGYDTLIPDLERIRVAGRQLLGLIDESLDPSRDPSIPRPDLYAPLREVLACSQAARARAEGHERADIIPDLRKIDGAADYLLALIEYTLDTIAAPDADPADSTSDAAGIYDAIAIPPAHEHSPASERGDRPAGGNLLVVDDNELNRDMLSRRLERLGYSVATAEGGLRALEMLREGTFDLLLLDIMMPDLNGYEVLERIKADERLRLLPVIVLSALDEIESAVRCIEIGADDYLPKPFDSVLLQARIGACLEKKRLRDLEDQHLRQIQREKKRVDDLLHVVIPIGVALTAEKDYNRLLERILLEAMRLCNADGGTLYLRTDDGRLRFEIIQNRSLNIALGGTTGKEVPFAPLRLYNETTGEPNHHYVVTHAALTGRSISIPDAYDADGFDFDGTKSFDRQTGYRSQSFLNVTLKNNLNQVIGVLQLINAVEPATGQVIAFDQHLQQMIESLSSLAAAALEAYRREQRLRREIEELRIEIDEVKKARQVADITETDYFQQLQQKARHLRAEISSARDSLIAGPQGRSPGERAAALASARRLMRTGQNGQTFYTVNGQRIHVHEEGQPHRKIALLIHGWSSSWYALSPLLSVLRDRYRCVVVDLPGYGESPPGPQRATIAGYADLLAELLQQLTDQPAVLVGHSMGGMISLTMALNYPRLIERMVLLCPTISGRLSMFINMFISPITVLERFPVASRVVAALEPQFLSVTDRLMRPASFAERSGITEADYHRLRADARRPGQGRVRAECFWAMRRGDLRGRLSRISVPSLVLWGMEDNTVPLRDASVVADEWPQAELRVIPKAGHWPQFETPDVTLRHIRAFLSTPLKLLTVEF